MRIIRGKQKCAKKVVIYGPEGIGKSTFASKFPDPVFIDTEGSTKDMDVARFEKASSWQMLTDQIRYVKSNPDICKTLVIDTADWAEQMCIEDLCARNGKNGIEDFGYGNGYVYAKEDFGRFLNLLSDVVEAGINVVVTAHAQIRKFEQPDELGAYDRYELKLGKKTQSQTSPLLKEWADMVLFANYKTLSVAVDDKGKKHKAQGGRRVMYCTHHPCWDAKNRYGLPDELPFEYEAIRHIIEENMSEEEKKTKEPTGETQELSPSVTEKIAPEKPADEVRQNEKESYQQSFMFEVDKRVPKPLRDLMEEHLVREQEIQMVVSARGYFPLDMDIWDYDPEFVKDVLIAAWDQVYGMVMEMRNKEEIPFN